MKLKWNPAGLAAIDAAASRLLEERAAAIAEACNRDSSWGGYHSAPSSDGQAAQVWSADARNDEARDQRLIRNLDAGR